MRPEQPATRRVYVIALALVLAVGVLLRLPAPLFSAGAPLRLFSSLHLVPGFQTVGFDEALYRGYVNSVTREGLTSYPAIVEHYIQVQKTLTGSILPPLRFLYIFTAYAWCELFGVNALNALHDVASLFSILGLLLSTTFAWRLKGPACALAVGALMSVAPTQIHMSQHALVDGFFAFWATLNVWLLWENLHAPRNWRWLIPMVFALALMVTTKENAAFVYFAILVLLIANRWILWGTVTRELLACMIIGPLIGAVILVFLSGGLDALITTYRLSVSKNYELAYAIMTGDGPWQRYLVDLLLVSPAVLLLAVGAVFRLDRQQKPELFAALFIGGSYVVMCNVKYGMNLRYANMWDLPLRVLALSQLSVLSRVIPRHRTLAFAGAVALIAALELRQYVLLFVDHPLYELVSEGLLRALNILKSPGQP
jgi:4-amino-4-deoxy-L-arabinose transferase-like glycosyltransferase